MPRYLSSAVVLSNI